jgi:hypothetical protein
MSVIGSNILAGASGQLTGGYQIERSLRFRSSASAYLNRTPGTASNRKTWTWSGWVKRGALSEIQNFFMAGTTADDFFACQINSSNQLNIQSFSGGVAYINTLTSTQVLRDPAAWYHLIVSLDLTDATQADRCKIYINGSRVTSFATNNITATSSQNLQINSTSAHAMGRNTISSSTYVDLYMTEINFVDGQALTPSDFGEYNDDTGVWQPIEYAGTYGTNGFYLNFSDNASTTTLGDDLSGNGNDWTTNNFSLTAGATYDSMIDVPTPYDDGGNGRGNYAVLNPLDRSSLLTTSDGNLVASTSDFNYPSIFGSFAVSDGKYYFEITPTALTQTCSIGVYVGGNRVFPTTSGATPGYPFDANTYMLHQNGLIYHNGSTYSYQSSYTVNDVIGVAVDATARKVWISKNGTFPAGNDPAAGTGGLQAVSGVGAMPSGPIFPALSLSVATAVANFGQRPFAYTPPTGFKALNTQNLPEPTIVDGGEYFNAVLYTGTGSSLGVTGVGFQPDWVWIKERSGAADHGLYDAVRGVQNQLESNTTTAETVESTGLTAFGSDGFTVGALAQLNTSADTYVAWNWKANGAGVSNTDGTITSTVSVNTTSGFSIVTYTGTGSAATVGHGLGAVPRMIIVKNRDAADAWQVYHAANTAAPETDYLVLNTTAATADAADRWNDTLPTSTVFSIGNGVEVNTNTEDYVAYCFSEVAGYSAFGSYTGNGSADGPFVFLGFRPAFVMIKRTDASDKWTIRDTARATTNTTKLTLNANDSQAEYTPASEDYDIVSNGFKLRTSDGAFNASGGTYIYMAFAESPFRNSLAR